VFVQKTITCQNKQSSTYRISQYIQKNTAELWQEKFVQFVAKNIKSFAKKIISKFALERCLQNE